MEGCRKRGKKEQRFQDSRDGEQERCWNGGMNEIRDEERRDLGLQGHRKEYTKCRKQERMVVC